MDFGLGLILSFTDNASAGINNAANQLMRLTNMAEQSTNSINNMADLTALSSLAVMSSQLGDTFLSMGTTISGVFQKLLEGTVNTGSQFESLRITVNALTGDAEKGQQAIQKLMDFSARTPFEINDLTGMFTTITANGLDAFSTLQGAKTGFEQELLGFIGDIMAFRPDVPAQQWGTAIRNAFSGEIRSLKAALDLNPEEIIGRDWGDTPEQIAQDFADLADNLGIAGLMMKNMGTWSQTLSNVSDQFTRLFLAVADAGVFGDLKQALFGITDALFELDDAQVQNIAGVIADSLSIIVKPLVSAGKAIGNFIRWLTKLTTTSPKLAKFIIQMIAISGALLTFVGVALKVVSSLAGLAVVFLAMGGNFATIKATLVGGLKAITSALLPLALAIGGMYLVWKTDFAGIRTLITEFVQHLGTSFSQAKEAINMSVEGMMGRVTDLQSKGGFWNNLTVGLMKLMIVCRALAELWNSEDGFTLSEDTFIKAKELGVLPLIEAILDLKYRFGLFKDGFIAGFKEVSDALKNFISGINTGLEGTFIDTALEKLTQFFELLSGGDADAWYDFGESFGRFTAKAIIFFAAFKILDSIFGKVAKVATAILSIGKAFSSVGKVIGGIGKAVSSVFPTFSKLGSFVLNSFSKLGPVIQQAIKTPFMNLGNLILPALKGIGSSIAGFFSSVISGPLLAALTAVLVPIITYAVTHWEEFKEKVLGVWETLKEEGMNIWNTLKEGLSSMWDNFLNAIQPVVDAFMNLKDKVVEVAGLVKEAFGSLVEFIMQKVQEIVNSPVFQAIVSVLSSLGEIIVSFLTSALQGAIGVISSVLQGAFQVFVSVINGIVNLISSALSSAMNIISGILDIIVGIFTGDLGRIWQGVQTIFSAIVSFIGTVLQSIWNIVSTIFGAVFNVISSILQGIWGVISSVWTTIYGIVSSILSSIFSVISSIFSSIWSTISSILSSIFSTVGSVWNSILTTVTNIVNNIKTFISNGFNAMKSTVSSVGEGIKSTVSNIFNAVKTTISNVIEGAKKVVSSGLSAISGFFKSVDLSLPKIKLPHFSISGSFSLNPPSIPHIGVEWYAKGGVFNKPTMIGVGEDGQEAVMPLEKNTGWITVLASKIGNLISSNSSYNSSMLGRITGTFSSALSSVSRAVSSLGISGSNNVEDINVINSEPPRDFKPIPSPSNTGGVDNVVGTNDYITNNSNQTSTTQDNSDNSRIIFQEGSIVVHVQEASEEAADRFAELIMEKIERKKKLKRMTKYKDMNYEEPEIAY